MVQDAGSVCVLLMVLLTGFLSPEGCRLSAGWLGHVNSANCALLLQCRL